MHVKTALCCLAIIVAFWAVDAARGRPDPEDGPRVISFELREAGRVSAAVYDADGRLVRELLHAVPKTAGKHFMVWDGLDRDGNSLPAGEYAWKVLQTPGLRARYLMSVGSSFPPGTDWPTACGPGTHATPFGIAADATGIYVAANTTENIETCLLKLAPDGKSRLWSALHPRAWDGALSLAADGGELYMLGHTMTTDARVEAAKRRKQLVYVYDAATGKLARRTVSGSAVGEIPIGIDVQWDPASDALDATDMDTRTRLLVVAYEKRNALRWYDAASGKRLDTTEVPAPQGVTLGTDGVAYVTTGNRIVKVSQKSHTPEALVTGLDKPGRIDADRSSGELLVYLAGTQQIQRFSPEGKLVNTYGARGGRKQGLYGAKARRSFAGFADLCADGAGGFYVTESTAAPRRTAHFSREGAVLREWHGGQRWAPHAAPEGDDPNVLWVGSHYGWIMRVLVSYEKKSWTVHSCYRYTDLAGGLVGDSWNESGYFRVYKHGGKTYLVLERSPTILLVDEKTWTLRPVTVCGAVQHATPSIKEWAGKNLFFQWNDANGDGMPQQAEVTFYPSGMPGSDEPYIAPDFTCFTVSEDKGVHRVYRFAVTSWNEAGAPVYGTLPAGVVHANCPPRFDPRHFADARWSVFLHQDARTGDLYAAFNDWTRDWCDYADSFMHRWSPKGDGMWTVGQRGVEPVLPGEVHRHLRGIAGIAHGCVIGIDVNGGWYMKHPAPTYVWDRDGLYVGGLLDAPDLRGVEKHWYQCGGEFCHAAVHTLPSGDVLFFGNWENEIRGYRITGWSGWQRQSGTIRLDRPRAAHSGQGLAVAYYDDAAMTKLRTAGWARQVDARWDASRPVPAGVRWTGTIYPQYGPTYTGPWTSRADKDCFEGTSSASRDDNASVTFRFHGTSVKVIGTTGPNHGNADVALNGKPQTRVDCYSAGMRRGVTLFARDGVPEADHELTVTVVGWYGKPRNKASSDSWVVLDQFIADGRPCDDAGYPYTFSAAADGCLELFVDRRPVIQETKARASRADVRGSPMKLLRKPYALQLNYTQRTPGGGARLFWSSPLEPRCPVPTRCLNPVLPGGYTAEDFRSPSLWPPSAGG
jgi:hypothetical protein